MSQSPNVPIRLAELLKTGDYLLFAGAGVGIEAGLPGWGAALSSLASHLAPHAPSYAGIMAEEAAAGRFLAAAEHLYLAPLSAATRQQLLAAVFGSAPRMTGRLRRLVSTGRQGIVTTNFDRSLEAAASEVHLDLLRFTEADSDLNQARVAISPFVVRLHGRIEVPDSLVFADRHYRALPGRAAYVEFFRQLFLYRNIIFFGFSFRDPVITELMTAMSEAVRSVFRRDAVALVPTAPDSVMAALFQKCHMTPVVYPLDNDHEFAWRLLSQPIAAGDQASAEVYESQVLRSYLAATYARAKGRRLRADRDRVLSGLLIPLLARHGKGTQLPVETLLREAETALALPRLADRSPLMNALGLLQKDGLISLLGEVVTIHDVPAVGGLESDAQRLVDGVISRAEIRFGISVPAQLTPRVRDAIVATLVLDGLNTAYSLIKGLPPDRARLAAVIETSVKQVGLQPPNGPPNLAAVIEDLIARPDREEERVLANISVVAFTTALLLSDPLLAESLNGPFEEPTYIDASVLLPFLSDGHPLQRPYASVLSAFEAGRVRVLTGYLNELIAHRRLALQAAEEGGLSDRERLARYVSLYELHNTNTFVAGYAAKLAQGYQGEFHDYLATCAPFDSEEEAGRYLQAKGITLEITPPRSQRSVFGELKSALKDVRRHRDDIVIEHDARQIELLDRLMEHGGGSYFVTADRALIAAALATSARRVVRRMLLPAQAAYLACAAPH